MIIADFFLVAISIHRSSIAVKITFMLIHSYIKLIFSIIQPLRNIFLSMENVNFLCNVAALCLNNRLS